MNPTIQSIYLNEAKLGPFLPESLYKLTRLDFISIKNNDVIGEHLSNILKPRRVGA